MERERPDRKRLSCSKPRPFPEVLSPSQGPDSVRVRHRGLRARRCPAQAATVMVLVAMGLPDVPDLRVALLAWRGIA